MRTNQPTDSAFTLTRQQPTHETNESENYGPVTFEDFIRLFRSVDWRFEVNQAQWALKALPGLRVTNTTDGCTLWVSSAVASFFIDPESELDEQLRVDRLEPWYYVGMENPPDFLNVIALDPHAIGEDLGFMAFDTKRIEDCFEWFFEEDYQSLYELFRWV